MRDTSSAMFICALAVATKFYGGVIELTGSDAFKQKAMQLIIEHNIDVRMESGEMLRRSRGYVPDALALPPGFKNVPPVLCLGADLKNTFCLVRGEQAVLSQHLGDLNERPHWL